MPLRCPSLHQRPQALALGETFARTFATNSASIGKGEIVLFRAMQESLKEVANSPWIVVEEYHGAYHQVTFTGSGTYSRANARCELSDLLVIVYDQHTRDARLSYIQAKSERSVASSTHGVAGSALAANLEQWDLLASRPLVNGVGSFAPPPDLLSSAQLDSVGSFAFFLHGADGVDIYYSMASCLHRPRSCVSRYGKLIAAPDICRCGPSPECQSVYGNEEFGAFLFGLMIGTPIILSGKPTTRSICAWLAAQLRGLIAEAAGANQRSDLANELANLLDPDGTLPAQPPNVGAKTLLILGVGPEARRRN